MNSRTANKRTRITRNSSSSDDDYEEENQHLKQENQHLKEEIKRLEMELKESKKKADAYAQNAADYQQAVTDIKSGEDIEGVYLGLGFRLNNEFRGPNLRARQYAYPSQLIRLSDIVLAESIVWGGKTDPDNYVYVERQQEPDEKEYDLHKYMGLHTAGRNLALAAENLHKEVVRTVERMTNRHIAEEHPMTDLMSCPILKNGMPFEDPVIVGSGITFERKALEAWFQRARDEDGENATFRCPSTRLIVNPSDIQPNIIVKQVQQKYRDDFKKDFPTKFTDFFKSEMVRTPRIVLPEGVRVPGDNYNTVAKFPPDGHNIHHYRDNERRVSFSFD